MASGLVLTIYLANVYLNPGGMDKAIIAFIALIERFIIPLVLFLSFLVYRKFFGFGADGEKEKEEKRALVAQHDEALTPAYVDSSKAKNSASRKSIVLENGEKAKIYKQALYAERVKEQTSFGINFDRKGKLLALAQQMKLHRVSLSGTVLQYKKLTGDDMLADCRVTLGDSFPLFLASAGSVK